MPAPKPTPDLPELPKPDKALAPFPAEGLIATLAGRQLLGLRRCGCRRPRHLAPSALIRFYAGAPLKIGSAQICVQIFDTDALP